MRSCAVLCLICLPSLVAAGELKILPPEIVLNGPRAIQQLLLVEVEDGKVVADLTARATFTSNRDSIASVDAEGVIRPAGDGVAEIVAKIDGRQTMAKVQVRASQDSRPPSFRNDVIPMLTRAGCNSGACHGALAGKGGLKLSLRGYDPDSDHFVLTRQASARRVDRSQPASSLLVLKGTRTMPHGGGTRIPRNGWEQKLLVDWIAGGAAPSPEGEASITSLQVWPTKVRLQPGATARIVVLARYGNGRTADVTRLAKFVSSEGPVADVDEDGSIRANGPGESAISALFDNHVATMSAQVPYPNRVDADSFTRVSVKNFIDEHVIRKLRELNLPPSGTATDEEFIRRAFLDAAGILPTVEEQRTFRESTAPDKRARLIDALLGRPEFIDYWAYKWCDLLLVSTHKLPQPAMWAFYRSIRQAVADNQHWDRFAREILLSSGSSLERGGGNFFVLHKDIAELSESVAVTFLGMSIACARCHNHPLEKWTQDQYWAMANLFGRVGMKNGDRAGEIILFSQASGDVLHPRRQAAMPPTPLDGQALQLDAPGDRREHFANWLTDRENPFFARSIVNRIWKNFLGRGLIEAEDDLRETNPPSNPELLDALARDFIEHGYDTRHLIRLIMNSAAYQRSSRPVVGNETDDRYYSRYLVRRLSGEVILDSLSQVTGVPTTFNKVYTGVEGGTADTGNYPIGTRALQLPDSRVASSFLDAFGRPDRAQTCSCERQQDSTVGQALMLNNGQVLNEKLRSPRAVLNEWLDAKMEMREIIRRVYERALCRPPTEAEYVRLETLLREAGGEPRARREAIEDLFWAVLTSREFVFNR